MSDTVIRAERLSKQYTIGLGNYRHDSLRDQLAYGLKMLFRRNSQPHLRKDTIWVLKDVSFEVGEGEVVGIIGRNGAGKSTLLKILSRITEPTCGYARIHGRVGSLLEVGTGFQPDLTGRENIYLNGAILGMKKAEITRKFDEIVAFAETEKFLDTPVKHYSSGMYVRLAFAVAAHLEPEILIVDEVLAVGDAAFQKKCVGKMSNVAKEGRTVLFVSHNMIAVQSLCTRVIWLDDGRIKESGQPSQVVSHYLQTSFSAVTEQVWPDLATAPGNEKVRVRRACVRPLDSPPSDPITVRTPFVLEFEYWNLEPGTYLNLSLHIYNEEGIMVFNALPINEPVWQGRPFPVGLFRDVCYVPGDLLNDGIYRVELLVVRNDTIVIHRQSDILVFEVQDIVELRGAWYGKWVGAVRPAFKWRTELIEPDQALAAPMISSQLKQ
jgi:lipopolysaccharide transport system ATP-binding protein